MTNDTLNKCNKQMNKIHKLMKKHENYTLTKEHRIWLYYIFMTQYPVALRYANINQNIVA